MEKKEFVRASLKLLMDEVVRLAFSYSSATVNCLVTSVSVDSNLNLIVNAKLDIIYSRGSVTATHMFTFSIFGDIKQETISVYDPDFWGYHLNINENYESKRKIAALVTDIVDTLASCL